MGISDSTQKTLYPVKYVCYLLSKEQNQNFHNKIIFPLSLPMCFHKTMIPSQQITFSHTEMTRSMAIILRISFQLTCKYSGGKVIANSLPKKPKPHPKPKEHKTNKQKKDFKLYNITYHDFPFPQGKYSNNS